MSTFWRRIRFGLLSLLVVSAVSLGGRSPGMAQPRPIPACEPGDLACLLRQCEPWDTICQQIQLIRRLSCANSAIDTFIREIQTTSGVGQEFRVSPYENSRDALRGSIASCKARGYPIPSSFSRVFPGLNMYRFQAGAAWTAIDDMIWRGWEYVTPDYACVLDSMDYFEQGILWLKANFSQASGMRYNSYNGWDKRLGMLRTDFQGCLGNYSKFPPAYFYNGVRYTLRVPMGGGTSREDYITAVQAALDTPP